MQGRRLPDTEWPNILPEEGFQPGDFWKVNGYPHGGPWHICAPNGSLGSIAKHKVIEHEDGLISVPRPGPGEPANSILIDGGNREGWHGWIEHGVWESV